MSCAVTLRTLRERVAPRSSAPSRRRRLGPAALLATLAIALGGCTWNWPTFGESHGADVQGQETARLFSNLVIAGFIVGIAVGALILFSVLRFRRRGEDHVPRQFHENIPLEVVYTIVPLIIIIVIFVFTIRTENEVDAVNHPATATVNVTAYQWGWIFHYDGTDVTVQTGTAGLTHALPSSYAAPVYPQLVLPAGETTKIIIRSEDVIHDFYVHAFNFDRFAQPGVRNVFEVTPNRLGVYPGQCSEYCGLYHSEMLFSVAVVSPSKYNSWLSWEKAHPNAPQRRWTDLDMSA